MFRYEYCEDFEVSQYERVVDKGKFCFREHVDAIYVKQEDPLYKGNVLIEALPQVKDFDKTFEFLKKFPTYSEEERNYSCEYRIQKIFGLLDYLLPTSSNMLTDEYLSIIMRKGYVHKKIGTPAYMKILRRANENLVNGTNYDLELIAQCSVASNPSTGCMAIGASGSGKTTGVNNSLCYYPQVIRHVLDYQGSKSTFTQIPYIRVDCSFDGRISGVCNHFFQEIDLLLGTNYSKQYSAQGSNINKMIAAMSFLALKYAIGVLVVDEIQHIRHTNNGQSLFNFFVTLTNTIKIPIVYIGTYKAFKTTLGEEYAKARKGEGIGLVEYYRLEKNNEFEWDPFIETLWNYQWIKNKTVLTQELKDLMYKKSLGIIDRVNKLFMAVQLEAIHSGEERITSELINRVADQKFQLTGGIIKAYKSGNRDEISKFDDIIAPDIKEKVYQDRNKVREKVNEIYNSDKFKESINKQQVIDTITCILNQTMQYKKDEIEKIAITVVNRIGFVKDMSVLLREVAKVLLQKEIDIEKANASKDSKSKSEKGDKIKKQPVPENFAKENIKEIFEGID